MSRCVGEFFLAISLHPRPPSDVEPPSITCPKNITVKNEKNMFYASVSWRQPTSSDNSGFHPIVTSVPVVNSPMLFKIGTTEIKVRYFLMSNIIWQTYSLKVSLFDPNKLFYNLSILVYNDFFCQIWNIISVLL